MKVRLKEYMTVLEAREILREEGEPKDVPSLSDLAAAAGVTFQTMSRLANNHGKQLSLELLSAVIAEFRRRGFDTRIEDVLAYEDEAGRYALSELSTGAAYAA